MAAGAMSPARFNPLLGHGLTELPRLPLRVFVANASLELRPPQPPEHLRLYACVPVPGFAVVHKAAPASPGPAPPYLVLWAWAWAWACGL